MWLEEGQHTKYLGVPVVCRIANMVQEEWAILQVKKHLIRWAGKQLSLARRILIVNQVFLASVWYLALCLSISEKILKGIRSLVRNFL